MQQIIPRVFLGDLTDAANEEYLKEAGVTATLNVCSTAYSLKDIKVLAYYLVDGPGNEDDDIRAAVSILEGLYNQGETVLIHCLAGRSRSPTILALFLVRKGMFQTFDKAIEAIVNKRPIVEPNGFLRKQAREILREG